MQLENGLVYLVFRKKLDNLDSLVLGFMQSYIRSRSLRFLRVCSSNLGFCDELYSLKVIIQA